MYSFSVQVQQSIFSHKVLLVLLEGSEPNSVSWFLEDKKMRMEKKICRPLLRESEVILLNS